MTDPDRNSEASKTYPDFMDSATRATIARMTGGMAPSALSLAVADWWMHLATAPGKQAALFERALQAPAIVASGAGKEEAGMPGRPDRRFAAEEWDTLPFSILRDGFLLTEAWWQEATTGLRGMSPDNEAALSFAVRQVLDIVAPSNFPHLNPEVLTRMRETNGESVVDGFRNAIPDARADSMGAFRIGSDLAATTGKVVARSHLAELIQYSPATEEVHGEPILIVPAWIMKYYILDLSERTSLVRWLVARGYTVFMLSWRNPGAEDRDLGMKDYLEQGPRMALDAIGAITGSPRVHAVGYCLGGTLLAIEAAAMARAGDDRLATMTLLAAQVDFSEPGELALFVSEAQVAMLEDLMWQQGYLDGDQMAGAFTMLRSNDLIWSRMIHEHLMGEEPQTNEMMAWNADTTRMPCRMHSEYLRALFLENRLAHGKYRMDGKPVTLHNLDLPIFAVGTETDHVAPWKSVYKIHHLTDADVTFALTNGGHNAGIVSEPGHRNRHYRLRTTCHSERYLDPDTWLAETDARDGSWWTGWDEWLQSRSVARQAPPPVGNPGAGYEVLGDAPGTYVFQR